eukprot:scaffold2383_cov161-Amphora_coffeaeformis.AAC.26
MTLPSFHCSERTFGLNRNRGRKRTGIAPGDDDQRFAFWPATSPYPYRKNRRRGLEGPHHCA